MSMRQMILIPAGQLATDNQRKLSMLDQEISSVLNNNDIPDSEKAKKYVTVLHSYLQLNNMVKDQATQPLSVRIEPSATLERETVPSPPPPPSPITPKPKKMKPIKKKSSPTGVFVAYGSPYRRSRPPRLVKSKKVSTPTTSWNPF